MAHFYSQSQSRFKSWAGFCKQLARRFKAGGLSTLDTTQCGALAALRVRCCVYVLN